LRPEDGRARPKHVVTIGNKIQNQDSCVFRRTPPPSLDLHKHNGDDEPEDCFHRQFIREGSDICHSLFCRLPPCNGAFCKRSFFMLVGH
jgi:hypothetical protein